MTPNQNRRWLVLPQITSQAKEALADYSPIMQQILFNRGYADEVTAQSYLNAKENIDYSPYLMTGVAATVERLHSALEKKEQIVIYGDYDVDGVTATVLLVQALRALGGDVTGKIPNRFDEGYGLNNEALSLLRNEGVTLVITVDCGIRSHDEATHARNIGIDLVISDHHKPAEGDLPVAYAIINPKQAGDQYPDKDLAGVGVAYKVVQALFETNQVGVVDLDPDDLLDLVALGTVADLAPLIGENRILVRKGLKKIQGTKRQGLISLAAVADLTLSRVTATSIGFSLGPRLNAAGRLESALAAYELLTTTDTKIAGFLAQQLNVQNRHRQEITRKILSDAVAMALTDDPTADLIFAIHPDFNAGVVGLAAARLVEIFYRPAVVGQISSETTRCSCRSIPEFHITDALDQCKDLLIRHGGHAAAAGFTVRNENLKKLEARLKSLAKEQLNEQDLRQTLTVDADIPLSALKPDLLKQLEYLQPTGYGNPEAVFVSRNVRVTSSRTVGEESKHLKLVVTDGHVSFDAIGFRLGHLQSTLPQQVDVVYTFECNEFNGRTSLQINLKDVRTAGLLKS